MGQDQAKLSMGAGCCVQRRLQCSVDWLDDNPVHEWHAVEPGLGCLADTGPLPSARSNGSELADDDLLEVASQIATFRQQQPYEAATLIQQLYAVQVQSPDDAWNIATAVHRKTQVSRVLASFQKPLGPAALDRMRSCISALQQVSARSEAIARVFEVFEDYMDVHLVLESCSGGSVYERILERQYFTEQESAVLIQHMLRAVAALHEGRLYHGSLTPDSFRFLNSSPHSPLKLTDFGLEQKVHRWDANEQVVDGPDPQNPRCPQFFETCKIVFFAPEVAPPYTSRRRRSPLPLLCDQPELRGGGLCRAAASMHSQDILDKEVLADVISEHWLEHSPELDAYDYRAKFEAADLWGVGSIAFLLLCGYPPFFAPSRNAILGRIHRGDVAFDPPFWSKISEEAKDFVSRCLKPSFFDRISVHEALEHPWIKGLAETSPSGSMFTSFMLNLRRFYRTSLIEKFVANVSASTFRQDDMQNFLRLCREIDLCHTGFFTASDLKHVLSSVGHGEIADAITDRFLRVFRHPGESYIDYTAMLDSVFVRQQRIFEGRLWVQYQRVCLDEDWDEAWLPLYGLSKFLGDEAVVETLMREVPANVEVEQTEVCKRVRSSICEFCNDHGTAQIEFHDLAGLLFKLLRFHADGSTALPAAPPPPASAPAAHAPEVATPPVPRAEARTPREDGLGSTNHQL